MTGKEDDTIERETENRRKGIHRAVNSMKEELKGNQHKIDANKNKKIDAHDFEMLRAMGKKKQMEEESKSSSDPDMQAPRHPSQGGKKYDDEIKPQGKEKEPEMENMPEKTPVPPRRPANLEEARGKRVADAVLAKLRAKKMDEEQVYEGVMSRIKVGKSKKTPDGTEAGVKYKGRNIGKIQKYGEKYGAESPYQDMMYAGARSPEEAINALRKTEADRLRGIRTIKKYLSTKKMNEEEDDKPKFADGNKVTPLLSKLSDQERKDYDKASAEVEKMRGKPIDLSKPGDSAKSEPETEKPVKVAQAATGTASDAPSPAATTPKSGEFSSSRTPSGAKRLSADAVSDYEKETANRQRLNRASIEAQKKELESQKEYDAVMQQRNAYSKEREEKGIVPKKYRWESAGEINEKAPPGAKFERMVKHIKSKYAKGGLSDKEKSIAYATAWKAKNKEEKND